MVTRYLAKSLRYVLTCLGLWLTAAGVVLTGDWEKACPVLSDHPARQPHDPKASIGLKLPLTEDGGQATLRPTRSQPQKIFRESMCNS